MPLCHMLMLQNVPNMSYFCDLLLITTQLLLYHCLTTFTQSTNIKTSTHAFITTDLTFTS